MKKLKVLYILAFARSGTTVLGNLLGELEGFVHVGEMHYFWGRMLRRERNPCGCTRPLPECPFWSRVRAEVEVEVGMETAPASSGGGFASRMRESTDHAAGLYGWPHLLGAGKVPASSRLQEYVRATELLYQKVAERSGSRVIVDSSKLPKPASYLRYMDSIQPFYVHVIRDPRGCVFSRQRRKASREDGKILLNPITATMDTLRWTRRNLAAAGLCQSRGKGRHIRIRYEDFASRPVTTLRKILHAVDEAPASLPFVDDRTAIIGPNHTVLGNLNRFDTGEVTLRLDDRWLESLRKRDHRLITTMTAPLLVNYGYPLGRGKAATAAAGWCG